MFKLDLAFTSLKSSYHSYCNLSITLHCKTLESGKGAYTFILDVLKSTLPRVFMPGLDRPIDEAGDV